jgi:hypothetical protein
MALRMVNPQGGGDGWDAILPEARVQLELFRRERSVQGVIATAAFIAACQECEMAGIPPEQADFLIVTGVARRRVRSRR